MRLGCCSWNFTYPHYEAPYDDAVRAVGELGFEGVEMIVFTKSDLDSYYSPMKVRELRDLVKSYGMEVSEFVIYAYCADGLESLNDARREAALQTFAQAAKVAKEMGAPIINIVSHWVEGLQAPIPYPPSYIHPYVPGIDRVDPKLRMTLPATTDWGGIWDTYVDSLRRCADIARQNDLLFTIEGHANVIVSGVDAMLRVFDSVTTPSIGVNFDTAWHLIQREYLPMSIHKLGARIKHVHVRDADGNLNYNLPPGQGIIDWHGVIEALQDVAYDGFLSLELGQYSEPARYAAATRTYLEQVLQDVGSGRVRT